MKRLIISALFVFSLLGVILHNAAAAPPTSSLPATAATVTLPESVDFATVEFGDGWDMSEFSDISQYLNGYGRFPSLINPIVQDGVFSATSNSNPSDIDAFIYPLFPGHAGFMPLDDLGSLNPVDSTYHCFYIAMKADTTVTTDYFQIFWYPDQNMPTGYGKTEVKLYPEWAATKYWKLFKVDLANPPTAGSAWNSLSSWQGIEVRATRIINVPFAIDWIRLTPCHTEAKYFTPITWTPDPAITAVWVRPQGTTRDIRVQNGINGSSGAYTLDTQGLAPGTYQVGLGTNTTCCNQWRTDLLQINAATMMEYDRPSPISGEDYATLTGNAWDMETTEDVDQIDCTIWSLANGILNLDTLYPSNPAYPAACRGEGVGEADPRILLNMPNTLLIGKEYRYLSFRMYQSGEVATPADGMMIRWIWTTTNYCTRVSADAPLEVGWNTYNIDLYDPFNGMPISSAPAANCADYPLKPWWEVGQIMTLRFDPNENWTGNYVPAANFHQEIDWMRLTKVDRVAQGEIFPILITLNKDASAVQYINFYYTTNLDEPMQHFIGQYAPSFSGLSQAVSAPGSLTPNAFAATTNTYLPSIQNRHIIYPPIASNQVRLPWYTTGVTPGEYSICAQAFDGYNLTTYCSAAPMQVTMP